MANQELVDAGRIVDRSKCALRKTTLNHFKKYLLFINSEFQNLDQIPENLIKDEILGKFSTYLKDHVRTLSKYTTHKNYLSSLHQAIVERFPNKRLEFETYYSNLCSNVLTQYVNLVAVSNSVSETLIEHHPPIRSSDREFINKALFLENDHLSRCWMNLDFCHAGRATELILFWCV